MKLCIAIPTFDRPEKIRSAVLALAPQLTSGVQIVISDNASRLPVSDVLSDLLLEFPDKIVVYRNNINVGACPNINRLIEVCDSDWIWTLGDDDKPLDCAIETVLRTIANVDDSVAYICFGYKGFKKEIYQLGYDLFIESMLNEHVFANVIGLSTGVYRKSLIIPHIQIAHYWSNSNIPHTAMLLKSLESGAMACFHSTSIMTYQHAEAGTSWIYERVMMGLPSLLEIEGFDTKKMANMVSKAVATYRYRPYIIGSFQRIFNGGGKNTQYWVLFFWKMSLHMRGVRRIQSFFFFVCAVMMSKLRSDVVRGEKSAGRE